MTAAPAAACPGNGRNILLAIHRRTFFIIYVVMGECILGCCTKSGVADEVMDEIISVAVNLFAIAVVGMKDASASLCLNADG